MICSVLSCTGQKIDDIFSFKKLCCFSINHPPWNWPVMPLTKRSTRFLWNLEFVRLLFPLIQVVHRTRLQRAWESWHSTSISCDGTDSNSHQVSPPAATPQLIFGLLGVHCVPCRFNCPFCTFAWPQPEPLPVSIFRNTFRSPAWIQTGFVKVPQSLYTSFTFSQSATALGFSARSCFACFAAASITAV